MGKAPNLLVKNRTAPVDTSKVNTSQKNTKQVSSINAQKSIEVTIAGLTLKLKSTHDENTVKKLAGYVDGKISEALSQAKGVYQVASIIACLNIAEELQLLKRKAFEELAGVENQAERLLCHLETSRGTRTGIGH